LNCPCSFLFSIPFAFASAQTRGFNFINSKLSAQNKAGNISTEFSRRYQYQIFPTMYPGCFWLLELGITTSDSVSGEASGEFD
jgi:hypothetical protein